MLYKEYLRLKENGDYELVVVPEPETETVASKEDKNSTEKEKTA